MSNPTNKSTVADTSAETQPANQEPADKIEPTKTHKVGEHKHDRPLTTCRIDPSGRFVFAGAEDLNVYRWELESGKKTILTAHDSWIRSMDFSPDGKWLYTGGWDGRVGWWLADDEQPKPQRLLDAHEGWVRWVRISPDGKLLATCGNDNLVKIWDPHDATLLQQFAGHNRHVYSVEFHPDGHELVSFDLMGIIKVWNLETGKEVRTIDAGVMTGYDKKFAADMGGARDMRFSLDGTKLACAGITDVRNAFAGVQTATVLLLDWESGKPVRQLGDGDYQGIAWGVRFHPDGFLIATAASRSGSGVIWFFKPDEEKPFHTVKLPGASRGLDMAPDNRTLAVAQSDGFVRVYKMAEKATV